MSNFVVAKEALDRLHRDYVAAMEEREELARVVRRIASEATGCDALLATQNILRIASQAVKVYEERRGLA